MSNLRLEESRTTTAAPPLSQSRIGLMNCPHLYVERAVFGAVEVDNIYALRGREFHEFMDRYVAHLVETRQQSDVATFDRMVDSSGLTSDALDLLRAFRDDFAIDPESVLCAERRFYLDANFNPVETLDEAAYEGKPDLVIVDGAVARIPDYKSQYQIQDADTPQARLYALIVMLHYPFIQRVIFELQFVRYHNAARSIEFTRDDIPRLQRSMRDLRERQVALHADALAGTIFNAMPGDHCAYCPKLFGGCPIKELNPYTEQSAEDRLRFQVWLNQASRRNREILVHLAGAQGPLQVEDGNGNKYRGEFKVKSRTAFPLSSTLPVLDDWKTATGEDLSDRLKVGATDLNKYAKAKKRAPLAEQLDGVKIVTSFTEFHITGVDEEEE
jgi:hypothetical protein